MRSETNTWPSRTERYSLRKSKSVAGVASVLVGLTILGAPQVAAEEVTTSQTPVATEAVSTASESATASTTDTSAASLVTVDTQTTGNDVTQTTQTVQTEDLTQAVTDAQTAGITVTQDSPQVKNSVAEAVADNASQADDIAKTTEDYTTAKAAYDQAQADYQTAKAQNDAEQAAYAKTQADLQDGSSQLVQDTVADLVQGDQATAQVSLTGVQNYISAEAVERLGQTGILGQYATDKLTASDLTTTNPYTAGEANWILMQVGDKVTATYTNLAAAKDGQVTLGRLVYTYELLSSTNAAGTAIVSISNDPTVTATMGAETTTSDAPLSMGLDLSFFDTEGNVIDLKDGYAILSISSLNHWDGLANVSVNDYPEAIELVAKDDQGREVVIGWGPYDNDGGPSMENGQGQSRSVDLADSFAYFGVTLSEDNPLKVVIREGQEVIDATTLTAGGYYSQENGRGLLAASQQDQQVYNGKSDVIGTYVLNPLTGVVTYTPTITYDASNHLEKVSVGDSDTVALLPGSSIALQDGELYAPSDNEYTAKGASYNASQVGETPGWDSPKAANKAYGSAGLVLRDGHLTFTASGNLPGINTVYWFATNAAVLDVTAPTPAPLAPEAPEVPTISYHENQIIQNADRITATVHYDGAGSSTPADHVQETDFSGSTGDSAVTVWSQNSHTFLPVATPVVPGYYASATSNSNNDPSIVPQISVAVGDPDVVTTVTYSRLGSLIPVDQDGNAIPGYPATVYPNDPIDATKIGVVTIPNIPGLTPYINGQAVTPGGSYVPQYLEDDTTVVYRKDNQEARVIFRDDRTGQQVGSVITLVGPSGEAIDFSTANQRLKDYLAEGYQLVPNQMILDGNALRAASFDSDSSTGQDFVVRLIKDKDAEQVIYQGTANRPGTAAPETAALSTPAQAAAQANGQTAAAEAATLPETGEDGQTAAKASLMGSVLMAMAGLMGVKLIRGRHGRKED